MKILIVMLLIFSCGCVRMADSGMKYIDSDKACTRVSAKVGLYTGSIVGVPAAIISLPVTIPMSDHSRYGLEIIAPWYFIAMPSAAITGYISAKIQGQ